MQHFRQHPEDLPEDIVVALQRRMSMTEDKAEKVRQVVRHGHGNITAIRQESAPAILEEFDKMEDEVAAIIAPKQRQEWHETAAWVGATFLLYRQPRKQ